MLFRKPKTFVMDLDTLSDPRITKFLEFGLVSGTFLLPQPPRSKSEAESTDVDHRSRRAWEAIERIRRISGIKVKLSPGLQDRDALLAALRKHKATLITINPELKAGCDGIPAVWTNEMYDLFKPLYLPGTEIRVKITKKGKEKNEGIGYLEGGVKVVVEESARSLGSEIEVIVKGGLDTGVGKVVFARPKYTDVN